jgi:D-glycero-alpha-D-manno-heptose 1-phosphate guanylyltransferase
MVNTAIILAGGLGTRIKDTVPNLPKPMAPINGRPFLEYQIDYLIQQGITKIILSVGYLKEAIINHFGNQYKKASIEYSIESSPLGTGGALMLALKNQTEPVLVINGDTFFEIDLMELAKLHHVNNSKLTIALFRTDPIKRYMGIEIGNNGEILTLKMSSNASLINGGIYLIEPFFFDSLDFETGKKFSFEDDILVKIVENGDNLFGKEFAGLFIDIGIPDDYYRAQELL